LPFKCLHREFYTFQLVVSENHPSAFD